MNKTILMLFALLAMPAAGASADADFAARGAFEGVFADIDSPVVVRAQGPTLSGPVLGPIQDDNTSFYPPTYGSPNVPYATPGSNPFLQPAPMMPAPIGADPFLGSGMGMPYAAPAQGPPYGGYTYGINGPQPYRYGWTARYDLSYMPSTSTSSPNVGKLGIFGLDLEKEYVAPMPSSWVFSIAPQYNMRLFDGPRGTPGDAHLPGDVHRLGLGLKLATPEVHGKSFEVGFNPAIATDFENSADRDTFQFDGHAVMFWRLNPQFMLALGAAYWDRVDDIILPYAGVVYTPSDYLEFRLLFPKPRVSLFLGAPNGVATWLYVSGEYHVESYQISLDPPGTRDEVQFKDWRVLGGARFETGWLTSFIEAGWVFGREVEFARNGTDFDINTGFITRAGFRY